MYIIITIFLSLILSCGTIGINRINFNCLDGHSINLDQICDGKRDCAEGSDETKKLCSKRICPTDTFRCFYGGCIDKKLVCDGSNHCDDGSDEHQCGKNSGSCEKNEFKCASGECITLKDLCDNTKNCKDNSDETEICNQILSCPSDTYRCKVGGCIYLEQRCDGHNDCIDGSDESNQLCNNINCTIGKCHKNSYCSPVISNRINAYCEITSGSNKGIIPCDRPLPPGTVVTYECKPYYVPVSSEEEHNKQMICQPDGTWNRESLKCIPDCGSAEPEVAPLIVKGWLPERGKYPWHAVIFALHGGNWTFTCGGTLITEKVVLTAAHCTWKMSKELLQVGLGKYYSDYYKSENSAQIRNISKIIRQPLYQDLIGNFGSDIAILILNGYVEFSPAVRPACLDWDLDDITGHLEQNSLGLIVGMGITEKDTFSNTLRATYLPVVDDIACIKSQKRDFKKYVTFTSFCAGWGNGTGVCNGDSGGGLVFPLAKNSNKFTLQGIVSVSPRRPGTSFCDPRYYTVFTKVGIYVQWISKVLEEIHNDVNYEPYVNTALIL